MLVVGMVLDVSGSPRQYISYAIYQCVQFSHIPKYSHEIDIKHIARYLKGTKDNGLITKPNI